MRGLAVPLLLLLLSSGAAAEEILGGSECRPHSRPYMAHLEVVGPQGHAHRCGGFLIRRDFVLTAAHCAGRSITVTLGAHNTTEREGTWQRIAAERQFPHPGYRPGRVVHDIMLLKLREKAALTLAVGPLPLPARLRPVPPGRLCRAVGWGRTSVGGPGSDVLREAKMRLLPAWACGHFAGFRGGRQLCVGSPATRRNVYKGDSGGPLLCAGIAHGVASYVHVSARPPAVFTRISYYRDWINRILRAN
ncbi:mast cell protease 2-like [Perognathus longimembris pacificus]|uniref:mast cell protease 2-like n=1 Tax=Perognathus longimembris pacificus TaxID=214514 RepID=UPI002018ED11|nr:mast cell protease 2-like [Perognathus longimembris pacificus]